MSPVKTKGTINRSVRPKIKREISQRNVAVNNEEDLTPSPIFSSKFKTCIAKSNGEKCLCMKCSSNEIGKQPNLSHSTICGCHDCFVKECHETKPLSKDKLINVIRNFIANREASDNEQLESHPVDCMCKNHLIFYKKNKITILDKFLNKQKYEEDKPTSTDKL